MGLFTLATVGGHGFLHQFHRLGQLLEVGGIEVDVLVEAIAQQAHGRSQIVGIAAQGGWIHAIGALGLLQQAEKANGHQPGVVEIRPANAC